MHAGLHKTGTTTVQTELAANGDDLARAGVLLPMAGRWQGTSAAHHNLAHELLEDARFRPARGTWADLVDECDGHDGHVLLSSEDFEGALGDELALSSLRARARRLGRRLRVVFSVRNQVEYVESLYLQLVRTGHGPLLDEALGSIVQDGRWAFKDWIFHFDYHRLVQTLHTAGIDHVVRPFPSTDGPLHDTLLAGFTTSFGLRATPSHHNAAAPSGYLERLLAARSGRPPSSFADVPDVGRPRLSTATAQRLAARFAASNRALEERTGVRIAPDRLATRPERSVLEQWFTTTGTRLLLERHAGSGPIRDEP